EDATNWRGEGLDTSSNALSHSTTLTQSKSSSANLLLYHSSKTSRLSATRTTRDLVDLNGDGLPDILLKRDCAACQNILVQYNRGGDFAPYVEWKTPLWTYTDGTAVALSPIFDNRITDLALTGPDVLSGTGLDRSI